MTDVSKYRNVSLSNETYKGGHLLSTKMFKKRPSLAKDSSYQVDRYCIFFRLKKASFRAPILHSDTCLGIFAPFTL